MDNKRRVFIQKGLAAGAFGLVGLLSARAALAAWPQQAFAADTLSKAIKDITGAENPVPSEAIEIKVPDVVESGASVPVEVSADLTKVESIVLLADNNQFPLISSFRFSEGALPFISVRIKLSGTSNLFAVVMADGKLYSASKSIRIAVGR